MHSTDVVLITGGCGFVGQAVADRLVRSGATVRALDSLNPQVHRDAERARRRFPGQVVVGDVRDDSHVRRAVACTSAVVHLAAETGVGQSMYEVDRYVSVNVDGTRTVVEAAAAHQVPVLVASSRAIYGNGAFECARHGRSVGARCCEDAVPSPSRETDGAAPVSIYGQTKLAAEDIVRSAGARRTPTMAIRPQNIIGPGQALHNPYTGVLAAFAARLRQGKAPIVYGTGHQTRDFIDVTDVAEATLHLLSRPGAWSDHPVLNIGSGVRTSLLTLATTAQQVAGVDAEIEFLDITRPGDVDHACADMELATRAGVPKPVTDLRTSLAAYLAYASDEDPVDPTIWARALDELASVERDD